MFHTVEIKGYRGLKEFKMTGLGRVNLLVGTNNSGKTSLLEALHFLFSEGDPEVLLEVLRRRKERVLEIADPSEDEKPEEGRAAPEYDIRHLFYGHNSPTGTFFSINAENGSPSQNLTCSIGENESNKKAIVPILEITGTPQPRVKVIPLTINGGISLLSVYPPQRLLAQSEDRGNVHFLTTNTILGPEVYNHWSKIALKPDEKEVLHALQCVDSKIEDIRLIIIKGRRPYPSISSFIVKLKHIDNPVPIGSLGDGVSRMLALAVALNRCKNGALLIDEIDTGLHFTVMDKMWRMVFETAKRLNIQVFATTHSRDCVDSLAVICKEDPDVQGEISLQRIEPEKGRTTPYTEAEIRMAAERNIEMR